MARKRLPTVCVIMLLQAPPIAVAAPPDAPEGLFVRLAAGTALDMGDASLEAESRRLVPEGRRSRSVQHGELRSRAIRVDVARLGAARDEVALGGETHLRLNLFHDVDLRAVIERTAKTRYGWSLSGRIDGDPHGSVTLVVHGDILAGAVHSREGTFRIASRNGAIHTVREVSGDFVCGVDGRSIGAPNGESTASASGATASEGDDGSEVDLLVLFTQAALDVEGNLRGMQASIDLAVAWTNDAYEASGVNHRLNLVAAVLVDYEESSRTHGGVSNQEDDLEYLAIPGDGILEEGLALRDAYAADVVHLIVDQSGGGGIARVLDVDHEDPSVNGFSVSNSLSWPNFLAHEVGHVMGLLHDRYTEADSGWRNAHRALPPYAYGYVNQRAFDAGASEESRWRTIMSYSRQFRHAGLGFSVQLPRFSNPNQRYPAETGDPLGVPGADPTDAIDGPADAVRSLNETGVLVAGFRESATRCGYRLSEARRDVSASGGEFTVGVDAASSCAWTGTAIGEHVEITAGAMGNGTGEVTYRVQANDGPPRVAYVVLAGEMLAVYQSGAIAPVSVCERTPQVRDAIANATGLTCGAVSEFDLLEVRSLDLGYQGIDMIRRGDFTGLSNMVELRLTRNPIATIENGAFDDLGKLDLLDLSGCGLEAVPPAIGSLRTLTSLLLQANGIEHLPERAFAGLLELRYLDLSRNGLATLDEGVFSDQRKLERLFLSWNRITDITKETMRGPESPDLHLNNNPLGDLRPDAFAAIPKIWVLNLAATQLRTIPSQAVANVIAVLDLSDNRIDDLSGTTFPGWNLSDLNLANNALSALPTGVFSGFTSSACDLGEMELDLSGNPGAPFPLTLELDRVDAGTAAPGPAQAVVRVREGTPFSIAVRIAGRGGSSFAQEVTVVNGHTESEPFEVADDDVTLLGFAERPRVPDPYRGIRIAMGDDLRLYALGDRELGLGGGPVSIDLDEAIGKEGVTFTYSAVSSDDAVATVSVANGRLRVEARQVGTIAVTVTATDADGTETVRSFDVRVVSRSMAVPYMPPAVDDRRQGFVRVINHSGERGDVRIQAIDDDGRSYGPVTLSVAANWTQHFNSDDLERGNVLKGVSGGVGPGQGAWRLELDSDLDIEVLSYVRTNDGFLTAIHDVVPEKDGVHRVAIFNPGSNVDQVSVLRLVNPGDAEATVTIRGIDGDGVTPGSDVVVPVPAGAARNLSAADLEEGIGVTGALGDGAGKWQLSVLSDAPIRVMSLLESPGGHVTNLSTVPVADGDRWAVPMFPSASDLLGRQGFVRVINHGETSAQVTVSAFDESDRAYDPLTLTISAGKTVHFNSDDLELGNEAKGLSGNTGAGAGDWRLELVGGPEIEVLSYIRTKDGFLTSMHEVIEGVANRGRVVTFNPGRNVAQVSRLRLINAGGSAAGLKIRAVDDEGRAAVEPVRVSLPANSARSYTAAELESGAAGVEGALGSGTGKWRFTVESDRPITVMSLLESPTGHLSNLSTVPESD